MVTTKRIVNIISRETGVAKERIPVNTDFVKVLDLNGHEEALVYLELEKKLQVIFPDERMPELRTVRQIQKFTR